jgi:putative ABC transport system substrate-binding protein
MDRREAILTLAAVSASPLTCFAQQSGRSYRLGWLSAGAPRTETYNVAFVKRLAELGFVEGRNLTIEFRSAEGHVDRMPELAADLARRQCDIYLAPGPEATLVAIKRATRSEPIVIAAVDYDPVASGHVASFSRPGGRITGAYQLQEELAVKRLELLKELLPKVRRVAVVADPASLRQLAPVRVAAKRMDVELLAHEFERAPYDFEAAFAGFARARAQALLPLASGLFVPARRKVTALALQHRLPGMFVNSLWTEADGLLSYGVDFPDFFRRIAEKISMILKGAKPAELPVEQADVFEFAVNLKTAKALGVAIPPAFRTRFDRIIE